MVHPKLDPTGVDEVIDRLQNIVHDPIVEAWGETQVYGRVYKVQKEDRVELHRYVGNRDYQNILHSEGNKVFFIQGDSPSVTLGNVSNDLWLVCILKLDSDDKREDEEAHEVVLTALSSNYLNKVIGIEYGMDNLRRVAEDSFIGNFKYSDVHPYHVFMVKLEVEYSLIKDNC